MSANKLVAGLSAASNWTKTENGADAHKTTKSAIVDLFACAGAIRTESDSYVARLFSDAYAEDPALAVKMAFYTRNCRGGLGERKTSNAMFQWLATTHTSLMRKNLANVVLFGYWKDLYNFVDTPLEKDAFRLMHDQFLLDMASLKCGRQVSLLGKWLASENASSAITRHNFKLTIKYFALSPREYRKACSALREKAAITERLMSAQEWDKINFEAVPSIAAKNYRFAFQRHQPDRYTQFLEDIQAGKTSIKSTTLYPYDLVHAYTGGACSSHALKPIDATIEAQWQALPDYIEGDDSNMLVMADTSGSMTTCKSRPLDTAVGLAVYFAQRNHGAFAGKYMTFSSHPVFMELGKNKELRSALEKVEWDLCENTNIEAAFDLILRTAVDNKVPQKDLPSKLIIISDMQFDHCQDSWHERPQDYQEAMEEKYAKAGYKLPKIVYWNVASKEVFHSTTDNKYVQFISGSSASAFKSLITGKSLSAYELITQTLSDKIYDCVVTE